jgi:hypothetical protein
MIRQLPQELFRINGREFETPNGPVTVRVSNDPDAPPSTGGFSDQVWFELKFSNGKELTLVLSDAGLHHDPDGRYRATAFQIVEDWLAHGVDKKIEFFGT